MFTADRHDLRLNYTHDGLARVLIEPVGGTPLELLLASDEVAIPPAQRPIAHDDQAKVGVLRLQLFIGA